MRKIYRLICFIILAIYFPLIYPMNFSFGQGIASQYPGDVGIEGDSRVIFVEKFNEATINNLTSRWETSRNSAQMSFSSDIPSGSGDSKSILFNGDVYLYSRLLPGYDQLYVRYYAKTF